ncbi:MAG: methane monooxygenase/ammonia monooxygenase subunit A [Gammaproteobacteria bacterium]|jgi:methane/ammonia monooxygenase subunit A
MNKALSRRLELQVDFAILIAIVFALAGATSFVLAVTMGDWEYWVDWKDRRFWPLIPAVLLIIFPAGLSAAFWARFRLPIACTSVVLLYTGIRWFSTYLNFHVFAGYPVSFVWPSVFIPLAIVLDCTLLITRSVFLTGLFGAFLWGVLLYPANWPMLAAFHEPVDYRGELLTVADLLGYEYIRTGLPEYVRMVERSVLRTFGDAVVPLTAVFAGFLCTLSYYAWWGIGSVLNRQIWLKKI